MKGFKQQRTKPENSFLCKRQRIEDIYKKYAK